MNGVLEGRVGLLGDVHAEDRLLADALRRLTQSGVERILCVGDIADGPGDVDRACELLALHEVVTVRGNHDRWLLTDTVRDLPDAVRRDALAAATVAFLSSLPRTQEFSSPLGRVLLCHGLGSNDMIGVTPDDFGYALESNFELQALLGAEEVRIVVNGHTHRPMLRRFGKLTVVNAGTLFHRHEPGYVVMDFSGGAVSWYALGTTAPETRSLGSLVIDAGAG